MSRNIQMVANTAIFIDLTTLGRAFEVEKCLPKLRQQGRLIIQKAYADADTYTSVKKEMAENAIELIELPDYMSENNGNSAIRLTVDALETAFTQSHIETFVLCVGESDYTALFSKLRLLNKRIIVISDYAHLHKNWKAYCDEIYNYESFITKNQQNDLPKVQFNSLTTNRLAGRSVYGMLKAAISDLASSTKPVYDWQIKQYLENANVDFNIQEYNFRTWEGLWQKAQTDLVIKCTETEDGLEIALYTSLTRQEDKPMLVNEAITLFYQATLICPIFDHNKITLSNIALAMRKLVPNFTPPPSTGKGRGFKAIMMEAEAKGYVEVSSEVLNDSIQYYVQVLPKFHQDFAQKETPNIPEKTTTISPPIIQKFPEKNDNVSYTNAIWEQNLFADITAIKSLYDSIDEYVFMTRQSEDVSIKDVFAHCISLQTTSYNEQICRRAFNTILGSNILFSANNAPITKIYVPAIVEEIELFEDAENNIKDFIKSQLSQRFGENLDETKLHLLFYGKNVAMQK